MENLFELFQFFHRNLRRVFLHRDCYIESRGIFTTWFSPLQILKTLMWITIRQVSFNQKIPSNEWLREHQSCGWHNSYPNKASVRLGRDRFCRAARCFRCGHHCVCSLPGVCQSQSKADFCRSRLLTGTKCKWNSVDWKGPFEKKKLKPVIGSFISDSQFRSHLTQSNEVMVFCSDTLLNLPRIIYIYMYILSQTPRHQDP